LQLNYNKFHQEKSMATAFDVAHYVLTKRGPMSAMKLQKLVFYAQAWSLVWDDKPLFTNRIEAWANGPVVRDLYAAHRGKYDVSAGDIQPSRADALDKEQIETIDTVMRAYGDKSAQWLSKQTHSEAPWIEARNGLADSERGEAEIPLASMAEYYGSL
jgi:uncharacterized phage-associated protein